MRKKLTIEKATRRVTESKDARQRELTARHLLLHPDEIARATAEEIVILNAYVIRKGWKTLYGHDRGMYKTLRKAGEYYDLLFKARSVQRCLEILHELFPTSVAVADWLNTPHPDLAGSTALEIIRKRS